MVLWTRYQYLITLSPIPTMIYNTTVYALWYHGITGASPNNSTTTVLLLVRYKRPESHSKQKEKKNMCWHAPMHVWQNMLNNTKPNCWTRLYSGTPIVCMSLLLPVCSAATSVSWPTMPPPFVRPLSVDATHHLITYSQSSGKGKMPAHTLTHATLDRQAQEGIQRDTS